MHWRTFIKARCDTRILPPAISSYIKVRSYFRTLAARSPSLEGCSISSGILAPSHDVYTAPEVKTGSKRGRVADFWSLGCVFFEMLSMLNKKAFFEPTSKLYPQAFRDKEKHTLITSLLSSALENVGTSKMMGINDIHEYLSDQQALHETAFQAFEAFYASTLPMLSWNFSERPAAIEVWCKLCRRAPPEW